MLSNCTVAFVTKDEYLQDLPSECIVVKIEEAITAKGYKSLPHLASRVFREINKSAHPNKDNSVRIGVLTQNAAQAVVIGMVAKQVFGLLHGGVSFISKNCDGSFIEITPPPYLLESDAYIQQGFGGNLFLPGMASAMEYGSRIGLLSTGFTSFLPNASCKYSNNMDTACLAKAASFLNMRRHDISSREWWSSPPTVRIAGTAPAAAIATVAFLANEDAIDEVGDVIPGKEAYNLIEYVWRAKPKSF